LEIDLWHKCFGILKFYFRQAFRKQNFRSPPLILGLLPESK
jgi:hypothetical protein